MAVNLTSYSISEHVYGDEQSAFDCNTKETGCPNACYSGKCFTAVNFVPRGRPRWNKVKPTFKEQKMIREIWLIQNAWFQHLHQFRKFDSGVHKLFVWRHLVHFSLYTQFNERIR